MSQFRFARFFSTDSYKAIKAQGFGYLNAINYMAPHTSGGIGNLCPHASPGCIALCLGEHSGQAAMVSHETGTNAVRESRKAKVRWFMTERVAFFYEMARHIARHYRYARGKGFKLVVRPNGATDIAWEGMHFYADEALAAEIERITGRVTLPGPCTLFSLFPYIQFVDYTKNAARFNRALPLNYDLTFSRSETNDAEALELLARGINVAVVFAGALPETWNGFKVIDGDQHDLRHLDEKGGVVVGLLPKGNRAKRDTSGFVVREAA